MFKHRLHEKDERLLNLVVIFALFIKYVNFAYRPPFANVALHKLAAVNSCFHLPKIMFWSLPLKLFDDAAR